jgi:hypothetical protein
MLVLSGMLTSRMKRAWFVQEGVGLMVGEGTGVEEGVASGSSVAEG